MSHLIRVQGMNGQHGHDMPVIHRHIAKRKGMKNQTEAKDWLSQNQLTPHHHEGSVVIIVPTKLHDGVRHMGGAHKQRNSK